MGDVPAGFRELKGFGPATEARLHEAGVYTWEALHEVVDVLANVRGGTAEPLRRMAEQLAERAARSGDPAPRQDNGERSEAFVVRMSLAPDGTPVRSSATHVRTQDERPWPGWPPEEVVRFIEEQTGLSAGSRTGPSVRARDSVAVLDGGTVVGGGPRTVDVVVPHAEVSAADGTAAPAAFAYRATLDERAYGAGTDAAWTAVAAMVGRGRLPEDLHLRFSDVAVPSGVRRLRVRLTVGGPLPAPV